MEMVEKVEEVVVVHRLRRKAGDKMERMLRMPRMSGEKTTWSSQTMSQNQSIQKGLVLIVDSEFVWGLDEIR